VSINKRANLPKGWDAKPRA